MKPPSMSPTIPAIPRWRGFNLCEMFVTADDLRWPQIAKDGECWDRARLNKYYEGWRDLRNSGVAVHCGECGAWNRTPHPVFLAWMEDMLGALQDFDCGWALWNFRGSFGLLDSGRDDAAYEDWQGCRLDSRLLSLLQRF
jgi:endoglucanase